MKDLSPQILGAIIGASISLITALIVLIFTNAGHNKRQSRQHTHEKEIEATRHLKSKLEECYVSFSKWETYFASMYVGMIGYVKGEMSEERSYELGKKRSQNGANEQVEMIISLYFPGLKEKYNAMRKARGAIVKFFPPNGNKNGDLNSYYRAQENFEQKARELKDAMADEIKNL